MENDDKRTPTLREINNMLNERLHMITSAVPIPPMAPLATGAQGPIPHHGRCNPLESYILCSVLFSSNYTQVRPG